MNKKVVKIMIIAIIISLLYVSGAYAQTVRVMHQASPEADHLAEHVKDFEEITGIKVLLDLVPIEILDRRMMQELIEQKGTYDVVIGVGGETRLTYLNKGEYIPIEDYLTKEELEQFYSREEYIDPRTGKVAGLTQFQNFQMLFYRKDLLNDPKEKVAFKEKYGRELNVPKTFQELYEVAEFFHRPPEMYGYFVSGIDWSWRCEFPYFVFGMGENFGDKEGNLTINTPGTIKAMEYMLKMTKFAPGGWEAMNFFDADTLMKEGKLFMYQNWTYIWKELSEEMPDKVGIATPAGDVEPGVSMAGYLALIPKKAPNPDAAVKFVKWFGGYDYQKSMTMELMGNLSSRSDVMKDPEVVKVYSGIEKLTEALSYAHTFRCTWSNELATSLYEVFFNVLGGKMTVKEGLDLLQNEKFADRRAIE